MASANVIIPKGIRGLQEDLSHLVNNPDTSDVVFVCEDGVEVHACRLLLTVRSSFFKTMFHNGMAESSKSTVSLSTVKSSVFIIILTYLFTGELPEEDICTPSPRRYDEGGLNCNPTQSGTLFLQLDWYLIMEVLVAARFLMLECLQRDILERLRADIPAKCSGGFCHTCTKAIQAGRVCYTCTEVTQNGGVCRTSTKDMQVKTAISLSHLCESSELWLGVEEVLIKSIEEIGSALVDILVPILASEDLRLTTLSCLGEKAWNYYLAKTRKTSHEKGDEFPEYSLDEYIRLRNIILWCAARWGKLCRMFSSDSVCLPGPKRVIQYLEVIEKPHQIFSNVDANTLNVDRKVLVKEINREVLKPFLEMVELSSIHPELLFSVIKPLDIIQPELLSKAFGEQAVIGTWRVKKRKIRC